MKKMILLITVALLSWGCEQSSIGEGVTWLGVSFDYNTESYVHDPEYNFSLVFENNRITRVIQPRIDFGFTVVSIEIISDTEMDIVWKLTETKTVHTNYMYNEMKQLIIDKFNYTIASIPFPDNLVEGVFVLE